MGRVESTHAVKAEGLDLHQELALLGGGGRDVLVDEEGIGGARAVLDIW